MTERPKEESLDWRYKSECPQCGEYSGWSGEFEEKDDKIGLHMACTYCGNRFIHFSGRLQPELRKNLPKFCPGAKGLSR